VSCPVCRSRYRARRTSLPKAITAAAAAIRLEIDPIIAGLLKRLPKSGDIWPKAQRKLWLQLLEGSSS
jgi:hypothetical protein